MLKVLQVPGSARGNGSASLMLDCFDSCRREVHIGPEAHMEASSKTGISSTCLCLTTLLSCCTLERTSTYCCPRSSLLDPCAGVPAMLVQNYTGLHAQQAPLLSLGSILGHGALLPASHPHLSSRAPRQHEQQRRRRGQPTLCSSSNGAGSGSSNNGASSSNGKRGSDASSRSLDERILSGEVRGSIIGIPIACL